MEDPLRKCKLHNKFGAFCFQAGKNDKALHHFLQALDLLPETVTFTNLYFNLANCYSALKQAEKAVEFFHKVITSSPYGKDSVPDHVDESLHAKGAYLETFNNLAVQYMALNRLLEAKDTCLKALELNPEATEANINLGNVLRQLGQREEAVRHVWSRVAADCIRDEVEFDWPTPIDSKDREASPDPADLHVVCVKWGSKYGPDYVNKLYHGVQRHLTACPYDFTCFTENPEGLEPGVLVQPLVEDWSGWWGKATLFSDLAISGRLLYIDLDTVVTGSLNDLAGYPGNFLLMGTSDIYCETAKDGFNSSIMVWPSGFGTHIYTRLKQYYKYIQRYICRFDHWLEMNVSHPDLVQDLYPSQFLDYTTYCRDVIPGNCRMVCFPREPKPHSCDAPWLSSLWT